MSLLSASGAFGKDTWLPGCTTQFLDSPGTFWSFAQPLTDVERVEGRQVFFKVRTAKSLGQAVIADGGNFPTAVDPGYNEAKLTMARYAHTIRLDFNEWEMLTGGNASAVDVVQEKMGLAVNEMVTDVARQQWGAGDAKLARCAAAGPAVTFNIQASRGGSGSASQIDRDAYTWLQPGEAFIDIVDATTGAAITNGTGRQIVSVSDGGDGGTCTITLDSAGGNVTTTTSHVVTWSGSVAPFSSGTYTSGESAGVLAMLATGNTYLNINRATAANAFWIPTVVTGATAGTNEPISLDRIQKLFNRMAPRQLSGMKPTTGSNHCLFSNYGAVAAGMQYMAPAIRYANPGEGTQRPDFAWDQILGLGLPWYTDVRAPKNNLLCIKHDSIFAVRPGREFSNFMDFMVLPDGSGGMWFLRNASSGQGHSGSVQAYLTGQMGFATKRPRDHGRLDDIAEAGV